VVIETVSVINLQTLKSIKCLLKVHKMRHFALKIQIFSGGGGMAPPQTPSLLSPLNSPPLANTSGPATVMTLYAHVTLHTIVYM